MCTSYKVQPFLDIVLVDELGILIVPGAGSSTFDLYEDDGVSQAYTTDYAVTRISKSTSGSRIELTVGARKGSYKGALPTRHLYLVLEGAKKLPNGVRIGKQYLSKDAMSLEEGRVVVTLPETSASQDTFIEIYL